MGLPHILLVEDSPPDAALARHALESWCGGEIEHQVTLAGALARLSDPELPPPTAVLLDLTLPDSSGERTFDSIAALDPPPVVVLSSDDDMHLALSLIERGAQDYLVKGEVSGQALARCVLQAMERWRVRQEERAAREWAVAAAEYQAGFVAAMSHEVRTPLNAIMGMSELLEQTYLDAQQREYVDISRRSGRALRSLLDNALDLSQLESGRLSLAEEPFELESVVYDCLQGFALEAEQKGIALVGDVSDAAGGRVVGDPGRLRQVLFNLIGNAIKFTGSGRVVVSAHCAKGGQAIMLEVSDTGIGIPSDRQSAVFERFVQVELGTKRHFGGSGLGLALCRDLSEAMGGTIELESQPGSGSTFRVTLPWRPSAREITVGLRGRRILVALADSREREAIAVRLQDRGVVVQRCAEIGDAERRGLAEGCFDAVLLEVADAEDPAFGFLADLDAETLPSRVVLVPQGPRHGEFERCDSVGAVALCKPASWPKLEEGLRFGRIDDAPTQVAAAPSLAGRRILLVEDAPENRALVRAHLRDTGCELEEAWDGDGGLAAYVQFGADLVLLDLHMPGLDGCEVMRRIRAHEVENGTPRAPIVILTADTLPRHREACQEAGCDAYLEKPFSRADLYRVIDGLLEAQAADAAGSEFLELDIESDIADLVEGYVASRHADAEALRAAARAGDFDTARRLGHNMKGSGAGYGLPRLSRIGAAIQRASEAGDSARVERLAGELAEYTAKAAAILGER